MNDIWQKMLLDSGHPIWKIIRLAVVGSVLTICCSWMYKNGFDKKDIVTIAVSLLTLSGFDQIKAALTKE